jgi:hypothetical protein
MPGVRFGVKPEIFEECAPLCDKELKVLLNCMGTTQSISCRDHMNVAHISADIVLWTYVDWEFLLP